MVLEPRAGTPPITTPANRQALTARVVVLPDGREIVHDKSERSEHIIVGPRRLEGKKAEDLVKAMDEGLQNLQVTENADSTPNWQWMIDVANSSSYCCWTSWGDKAATNRRALNHYAYLVEGGEEVTLDYVKTNPRTRAISLPDLSSPPQKSKNIRKTNV